MSDVTRILSAIDSGDPHAAAELLPLVYDELRALATARLRVEPTGHTLQPPALVHEAYLRLVGGEQPQDWDGRHKDSRKAGGGRRRLDLAHVEPIGPEPDLDLIALDEALGRLERLDARKAQVVKLRFFAGLTGEQAARALGIATSTADADWAFARCWLRLELSDSA